ncbi:hypothetical protein MGYG_08917 [Nannizzia gypsea CBS 118893]|uniref:Aminoglycoside phosphotransferase domain-containing protein n=1 Tax=Arthroderma gypseum (strain ATCC MYA-4604 / CBS 118893) TaxID=535722 RepID=E5QYU9_ARTGP|nr:hypothetical protein MGYG_08917 [Nannizzia gypsea CBS 118893]EFQ98072.1 hypothetical protein MGYG_08917 [Nannizzia gypsea CBS 118893]
MVFCYTDIHPGNFIISDDGHITIIDFSETSILPSSFARYAVISSYHNPEYKIAPWIDIPGDCDEVAENTFALFESSRKLVMSYHRFCEIGDRLFGTDPLEVDPSLSCTPGMPMS